MNVDLSGYKILIVEDSKLFRQMHEAKLKPYKFNLTFTENAVEAMKELKSRQYSLIILDINLPGISGLKLLKQLRKDEIYATVPIIMVTMEDYGDSRSDAFKYGANDLIPKPVDYRELAFKIENLLRTSFVNHSSEEKKSSENETGDKSIFEEDKFVEEFEDDGDIVPKLIEQFLGEDAIISPREMEEAISKGEAEKLGSAAHSLKGSAGIFCSEQVVFLCLKLEMLAKKGQFNDAKETLMRLNLDLNDLKSVLMEVKTKYT